MLKSALNLTQKSEKPLLGMYNAVLFYTINRKEISKETYPARKERKKKMAKKLMQIVML